MGIDEDRATYLYYVDEDGDVARQRRSDRDEAGSREGSPADLALAVDRVASAIASASSSGGHDATGVYVTSLTEAVMGVTSALQSIATALNNVAEAIRDRQ